MQCHQESSTCAGFLNGVFLNYDPAAPGNYTLPSGKTVDFGVDPDYLNQSRNGSAKAGILAVFVIAWPVVALRIAARLRTPGLGFGHDDLALIIAALFYLPFLGLAFPLLDIGAGRHIEWIVLQGFIDVHEVALQEIWDFTIHLIYTTAMYLFRVSALLFFYRLGGHQSSIRKAIWAAFAAITVFYLPQMFTLIFHCWPVTALWPYDFQVKSSQYTCLPWDVIYLTNGVLNFTSDFAVFIIPAMLLHVYKGAPFEKFKLGLVLFPGVLVLGVSAARLALLANGLFYPDQSWFYAPLLALESAEIGGTMIALSIPALKVYAHRTLSAIASGRSRSFGGNTPLRSRHSQHSQKQKSEASKNQATSQVDELEKV